MRLWIGDGMIPVSISRMLCHKAWRKVRIPLFYVPEIFGDEMLDKEILREPQHNPGTVPQVSAPSTQKDSGIPNHKVLVEVLLEKFLERWDGKP